MAELLKATGIYYRNELRSIHKNGVKLQPVYEAFTNSWESILEKYTAEHLNLGSIVIEFHYNAGMFEEDNENNLKNLQKIIITDNGIGLNEESFTRLLIYVIIVNLKIIKVQAEYNIFIILMIQSLRVYIK